MKRVLITGISGVGKSTVVLELIARGVRAVDLDDPPYAHLVDAAKGETTGIGNGRDWVWNLDRVTELLNRVDLDPLIVSGTSPNQGRLYLRFDDIILLSAPLEVLRERLRTRATNTFGKESGEMQRALGFKNTIEPLLRMSATAEIDTSQPIEAVIADIVRLITP